MEEDEEDLIILGVNDDDKLGMSVVDDEEEEPFKGPSNTKKKRTSLRRDKAKKKKKHKKHKKHKTKDVEDAAEPEAEPEAGPSAEEISAAKRRRRRERLEAQAEKEVVTEDLGDKVILNESTVYSMGNYCSRMLAGHKCEETSCSWSHFMMARDAASQFSKILQFR